MYLEKIISRLYTLRKMIAKAILEGATCLDGLLRKYRHAIVSLKTTLRRRDYRFVLRVVADKMRELFMPRETIRVARYY
jgi:hypothetical protein